MIPWEESFTKKLVCYDIISKEDAETYKFGMECLILKIIHCISYLCIAVYLQKVPELILIGSVLIPLRRNAGGYHAKTKTGCYLFSCCYIFIILLLSHFTINQFLLWGLLALSDIIIYFLSPADNENKRLDEKEKEFYRKKARIILILANIGCFIFYAIQFFHVGGLIRWAICAAAFLLVLQNIVNPVILKSNQ
jgi:accessory gene regulator B